MWNMLIGDLITSFLFTYQGSGVVGPHLKLSELLIFILL